MREKEAMREREAMCHVCLIVNRLLYGVNKFTTLCWEGFWQQTQSPRSSEEKGIFLAKVREGHKRGATWTKDQFCPSGVSSFLKPLSALGRKYLWWKQRYFGEKWKGALIWTEALGQIGDGGWPTFLSVSILPCQHQETIVICPEKCV